MQNSHTLIKVIQKHTLQYNREINQNNSRGNKSEIGLSFICNIHLGSIIIVNYILFKLYAYSLYHFWYLHLILLFFFFLWPFCFLSILDLWRLITFSNLSLRWLQPYITSFTATESHGRWNKSQERWTITTKNTFQNSQILTVLITVLVKVITEIITKRAHIWWTLDEMTTKCNWLLKHIVRKRQWCIYIENYYSRLK